MTRIQTKDHNDSLIAQVNSKTVENADLKAQIQEKVFANVALKNELRKLKGNNMDTKFAKPSILGKPVLQPPRNQSVVRQPNAFKSERPNFSKPRFASQVDVNDVLSKPVTPYYLPKVREYVLAKPHHVIAPGSFRNSQEEPYGSNDMAHNHYLEEARKKTQERNRNSKPSVMHTTSLQNTTNGSKPNPRSNNQISRSLHVSKSSCGMSNGVSLVDHSRNSSSFSDSKHFVCSTCHKCVFNANHDDCIKKFLKEVNSHAKKSSAVHEKPNTPKSCLRWKPTGRIFKIAGLRWIPTGKMFTDNTTNVDSEPPNGSNDDITNPYECDQTLNVSAGPTNLSAGLALQRQMASADNTSGPAPQRKERCTLQCTLSLEEEKSSYLRAVLSTTSIIAAQDPVASTGTPSSTTIDQDAPSTSTSQTTQESQSLVIPPELHEFEHLEIWELVPRPDQVMIITLKWIYEVKLDELGGGLKNKANQGAKRKWSGWNAKHVSRNAEKAGRRNKEVIHVLRTKVFLKKSSVVHEKPNTPRSCLRWKPTGRIFNIAGLRWIPTGKMFTDYTTKVDSEPPNGSNDDITNPYECDQTLNVGAGHALQRPNDVVSHQFRPRFIAK
ncbi:hypothetical protein Tco_1068777 [Tanacetum coccineum]|uniref:Integrase, catalytic region, zinc finger, CCHC-type, peptidase aspartic, catalytic n=1 Tax=Tanacetum coccineum TaxID=301880 RepID=A0ABQ5HIK3_9ASTR